MRSSAIGTAAVVTLLLAFAVLSWRSRDHVLVASFWFEGVTFEIDGYRPEAWGGELTSEEKRLIESTARAELSTAFAGLRVRFADARDGRYRVQVVQNLARHPFSPFRTGFAAAGESRSVWLLGGRGAVSFSVLAGNAISCAPLPWHRHTIVEGIGRGIGRAAAHEFAHLFFPAGAIDSRADIRSYEYHSAWRAEQYYGPMHWSQAWPLLVRRFGPVKIATAGPSTAQDP